MQKSAQVKGRPPDQARPGTCVYVVDDDAAVRKAIERLLRASGYICRAFESARHYLDTPLGSCEAACLVLDLRMPEISGTDLQARLLGTGHDVPIVFVTGHGDIPTCVKALKAGAVSFLTKPFDEESLLKAVAEALQAAADTAAERANLANAVSRYGLLSVREKEVFCRVVKGLLNKQIAAELGIAEKTVKVHRARVMDKMGAESVADLVRQSALLAPVLAPPQERPRA
jgi:FixJ family two-component response regulator